MLSTGRYYGRRSVASAFNRNASVIDEVDSSILGACFSLPGYAFLMTLAGACRGANRQRSLAMGTFLGYASGITLAWYLGYDLEWPNPLLGVWLGNASALAWAALWALGTVFLVDWGNLAAVNMAKGDKDNKGSSPGSVQIYEDDDDSLLDL